MLLFYLSISANVLSHLLANAHITLKNGKVLSKHQGEDLLSGFMLFIEGGLSMKLETKFPDFSDKENHRIFQNWLRSWHNIYLRFWTRFQNQKPLNSM